MNEQTSLTSTGTQTSDQMPPINSGTSDHDANINSKQCMELLKASFDMQRMFYDDNRDLQTKNEQLEGKNKTLEDEIRELKTELSRLRQENQGQNEKIKNLEDMMERPPGADEDLEVDIYVGFAQGDSKFAWRKCTLDTGSAYYNIIAGSVLSEVSPRNEKPYTGMPIYGLGATPGNGIRPTSKVELDWRVRGKDKMYTSEFLVWDDVKESDKILFGVDVLLGRSTLSRHNFLWRNHLVYHLPTAQPNVDAKQED